MVPIFFYGLGFFLFLFLNHVKDASLSRVKRFFFMFSAKNSIVFTLTVRLCDPFWVNVYVCSDFFYCVWIFNYLSSIYCKDILSHWFTLLPLLNATELKYTVCFIDLCNYFYAIKFGNNMVFVCVFVCVFVPKLFWLLQVLCLSNNFY